ncbi:MAG: hypothetical protein VXV96_09030 [Bdellovibrionota bacterium]|nr:hypothetical protein [Bdellovibrionota bacterium]
MSFRHYLALFLILLAFSQREWTYKRLKRIPQWSSNPVIKAYLFGDKSKMSSHQKRIHSALNLQHLMTPSGLHLASLLLIIGLISKTKRTKFSFLLILSLLSWPFDGLDSFKRMILFGLLRTNPLYQFKIIPSFLITFALTLIGGQYGENPLSFALSFIFLSTLLTGRSTIKIWGLLFFIQALISDWFGKPFFPLGAIYGLSLSMLSPFLFPFLLVESLFEWFSLSKLWLLLLENLYQLRGPPLTLPLLPLIPVVLISYRKKLLQTSLALCLLLFHLPLTPTKKTQAFSSRPPHGASEVKEVKNGVRLNYENGMRCFSRIKGDQWSTHCYK